jgi:hypothetical protein
MVECRSRGDEFIAIPALRRADLADLRDGLNPRPRLFFRGVLALKS